MSTEDQRTSSFTGLVSDAVSNTGMQGLPNIHRSKSLYRKTWWALICTCGIGVMVWQISLAVQKYYGYPTSTTVEYQYKTSLEFPAVTICNNNPIKKSLLENSSDASFLKEYMEKTLNSWNEESGQNTTTAATDQVATTEKHIPGRKKRKTGNDYGYGYYYSSGDDEDNYTYYYDSTVSPNDGTTDKGTTDITYSIRDGTTDKTINDITDGITNNNDKYSPNHVTTGVPNNDITASGIVPKDKDDIAATTETLDSSDSITSDDDDENNNYGNYGNKGDNNNNYDDNNNFGNDNNYGGGAYYDGSNYGGGSNYYGGNYGDNYAGWYDYYDGDIWFKGEEDAGFDFIEDFIALTSKLDRPEKIKLGHSLDTMMISCSWQGKKCNTQQFNMFNNYMYGNCFTFNSGRPSGNHTKTTFKTNKIGPLYGLSLELFIEQDEYIAGLSDGAGIRLLIHNQTYMPFPEDYGISLQPGVKASIGIKRKELYRASPPHGSCEQYGHFDNIERNAFLADIDSIGYTVPACMKTCYQRALIMNCSCYDYKVPIDPTLHTFSNLGPSFNISGLLPCDQDEVFRVKEICVKNVTTNYVNNKLGCSEMCHVPCFEVKYTRDVSYARWPSEASEDQTVKKVERKSDYFSKILYSSDKVWKKQWINDNFLKIEVYFSDLNYEVVKTFPSYDAIALISDLGGQAGLWLGVSIVAFFELFELVFDGSLLLYKYFNEKIKEKNTKHNVIKVHPSEITTCTNNLGYPMDKKAPIIS